MVQSSKNPSLLRKPSKFLSVGCDDRARQFLWAYAPILPVVVCEDHIAKSVLHDERTRTYTLPAPSISYRIQHAAKLLAW